MEFTALSDAVASLEKANAGLEPELLSVPEAKELLRLYARAERLAAGTALETSSITSSRARRGVRPRTPTWTRGAEAVTGQRQNWTGGRGG